MERLVEVIKIIANKYMKKIDLILSENILTLEYFIYKDNEKDIYKTLQVEEFKGKLKITFIPERIIKITDITGLEDIISILDKQSNAKEYAQEEIKDIKKKYIAGTKIKLIKMYDLQEVPVGTKGIIEFIDDIGTLHIKWENGSTLGLVVGVDEFEIIEEQEKICPKCGNCIQDNPALSRADNKTQICNNCGTLEALEVFEKYQREVKDENRNNN